MPGASATPWRSQVIEQTGTTRTAQLPVTETPRLISAADQTLLFNPLSVALRSRLATASPADQPIVRLNLGVALMRLGDYGGAQEQFEAVKLSPGPGSRRELSSICSAWRSRAWAMPPRRQRAWQAAAASEAWLTDDGPARQAARRAQAQGRTVGAALDLGVGRGFPAPTPARAGSEPEPRPKAGRAVSHGLHIWATAAILVRFCRR